MKNNIALGKAGEFRVASELLLRGHEVFLATADSGVDLILGNGKRVQVKVSHLHLVDGHNPKWKARRYVFSFKSWRKKGKVYEPHKLEDVDYVILWAKNDDIFLIVPAEEVRGNYTIRFVPDSKRLQSKYIGFKDQWDSLK